MSFIPAGEILRAAAQVRTLTLAHHPKLPDGAGNLVPPGAMLAFFSTLLDARYRKHLRAQYARFRAALPPQPVGSGWCSHSGGATRRWVICSKA
jgi:hypothetical protein